MTPDDLQDSGLHGARLLARLVQAGTLVLDGTDDPTFASAGACELFDVRDLDALRTCWADLRAQLRVAEWPHPLADGNVFCGRADLATPRGPRAIRFEAHGMGGPGSHRVVFVRDRARLLPSDHALLLASEAQVNRHLLTDLVHTAKGPLNNFNLTLALLAAGAARGDASAPTPETIARRNRHIGVLQSEAARLAGCIDEIHALALPHDASDAPIDLAAMSHDCARVLRHEATMHEVKLELDAPGQPVMASGDAQLVRLALLSFAICLIELTSPGGRVGWRVAHTDGEADPSILLTTTEPALPSALVAALFRLSCTGESEYSGAIAARLVIEAQRGDVFLHDGGDSPPGILLHVPARS
jgi:hypothetical protein